MDQIIKVAWDLNENTENRYQLVYEISELKPWNCYVPKKPAKYIVEFDRREFNDCLKIGDEIEIKWELKFN